MKKSDYITKYDYINYFISQPSMWFFTNYEIKSAYEHELKKCTSNLINLNEIYDLEDEEYGDESENDDYESYRQLLESNQNIDEDNPQIQSGLIIDKESKKFIIHEFSNLNHDSNFVVYDFDNEKIDLMENHKKTLELINSHNKLILFQAVFYDPNRQLVTKCDALIKENNSITLVETKATSSAKFHHFLDLLFQKQVLESDLNQKKYFFSYKLCLVKYERLKANEVSFIISETINLTKSINPPKELTDLKQKQAFKLGDKYEIINKKNGLAIEKQNGYYIDDVLNLSSSFFKQAQDKPIKSKGVDKFIVVNKVIKEFNNDIAILKSHKHDLETKELEFGNLIPGPFIVHPNDHSIFKDNDLWRDLRYLYGYKGYEMFKFSGNIIDFNSDNLKTIREYIDKGIKKIDLVDFLKGTPETKEKYRKLYLSNHENIIIDQKEYLNLMGDLKAKRVYFDFETINPAIRVIDNSLPFTQVVTQNSVIIDNDKDQTLVCNNLMCDPKKIDISFLKSVVDSLYCGPEYSYIVYNKSFECSRLSEINKFINEKSYSKKIETIINNIFDLADFFKVTKDKYVIFFKELNGFYSIKKILPLVDKYANFIFNDTKCIDYNTLEIKNGLICQSKTLLRFYNKVSDEEWNKIVFNSKKYCENDVRAMIAVLKFVEKLFSDTCITNGTN